MSIALHPRPCRTPWPGYAAAAATVVVWAGFSLAGGPLYLPVWYLALPSRLGQAAWGETAFQAVFQGSSRPRSR